MSQRLFVFVQLEFPWELGPPDGRYALRPRAGAEPERVVVLGTLGARPLASARGRRGPRAWRSRSLSRTPATPEPAPVATARATIVDPISLTAERQAQAWLSTMDDGREVSAAVAVLNRVLHFHRIASADPHIHEVSPDQALVIRVGWGEGEQVADGRWLAAREVRWTAGGKLSSGARRRAGRSAALRPQERLAELLSARGSPLLCEDLTLRARLDLDHGRPLHAAIELQAAYAAALSELRGEHREDLSIRIAELDQLHSGVTAQAQAALPGVFAAVERPAAAEPTRAVEPSGAVDPTGAADPADQAKPAGPSRPVDAGAPADPVKPAGPIEPGKASRTPDTSDTQAAALDEDVIRHALERLEAALRARTASGLHR